MGLTPMLHPEGCLLRCAIALLLLMLAMPALAQDALSGRYQPVGQQQAGADLRVEADGDGWQAWFGGAPRRLEPMTADELSKVFPGIAANAGVQCAASSSLLLCAVPAGIKLAGSDGEDVVVNTGYFATLTDSGTFVLSKLP